MLHEWKTVLIDWVNCYEYNGDIINNNITKQSLQNILISLKIINVDDPKQSIQEFLASKFPDFEFENCVTSEEEIYLLASLLLYFLRDIDSEAVKFQQLRTENRIAILKFTQYLKRCSKITYFNIMTAIQEACGLEDKPSTSHHTALTEIFARDDRNNNVKGTTLLYCDVDTKACERKASSEQAPETVTSSDQSTGIVDNKETQSKFVPQNKTTLFFCGKKAEERERTPLKVQEQRSYKKLPFLGTAMELKTSLINNAAEMNLKKETKLNTRNNDSPSYGDTKTSSEDKTKPDAKISSFLCLGKPATELESGSESFRRVSASLTPTRFPTYLLFLFLVMCILMALAIARHRSNQMKTQQPKRLFLGVFLGDILCKNDRRYDFIKSKLGAGESRTSCNTSWLWPQPTKTISLSNTAVPVNKDFFFLLITSSPNVKVKQHLKEAFTLLKEDIGKYKRGKMSNTSQETDSFKKVIVRVSVRNDNDPRMRIDTDESYKLSVKLAGFNLHVDIVAQSFCGARHGFETLSQLVWLDPYTGSLLMVEGAVVEDEPKFKYRGLLLDTARTFFAVDDILRTIDAMAANKMNTFHWHVSDSQSFPLKLKSVPQLADHGAYGPNKMYNTDDVKKIVRRARLRGIRVLIEIDTPAHVGRAWSWGSTAGLGELVHCIEIDSWYAYWGHPPTCQLNARNPTIYDLLEKIYTEIINLTEVDDIFHMGGGEVCEQCWAQYYNATDLMDVWLNFTQLAYISLQQANGGKSPNLTLLWSSQLTRSPYLEKLNIEQYGIQISGAMRRPESRAVLDSGYRSVISNVDAWFLDCGFGLWQDSYDQHCGPYMTWQQMYKHRPWSKNRNCSVQCVEGGEVCEWSLHLSAGELDARVWPRAAAVAERLWSDRAFNTAADVYLRLDMQRSRLLAKGVKAAPLYPHWCMNSAQPCLSSNLL